MFQVSFRHMPTIRDYAEAKRQWEIRPRWRSGDPEEAQLGSPNQKQLLLHPVPDGGIAARLYQLDVLTWYPDGRVRIWAYSSSATQGFVRNLMPDVRVHFTGRGYSVATIDRKRDEWVFRHMFNGEAWRLPDGTWDPMYCVSYDDYVANRQAMNAAYKAHGLPEFQTWFRAFRAMGGQRPEGYRARKGSRYLALLQEGIDGWQHLAWETTLDPAVWNRWGGHTMAVQQKASDRGLMKELHKQIWQATPGCITTHLVDEMVGWNAIRAWERRARQYAYYAD